MSISISAEKKLLTSQEFEVVSKTHYPEICQIDRPALIEMAKVLREYRDKARDTLRRQRRGLRGKGPERRAGTAEVQHGGLASKNQVLTQALRRVNSEIKRFEQASRKSRQVDHAQKALAMKRANPRRGYPDSGRTAEEFGRL